jgi:cysteine desulfuration protein SufE
MSIEEKYNQYKENLELLEDNIEKYQYLIELGKKGGMPAEYRVDTFLVPGCISQLWLVPKYEQEVIQFMSDSDAMITKGVATMVADIFSGAPKEQINSVDMDQFIQGLQLTSILSQNRRNGAYNMFGKVKEYATKI